MELYNDFVTSVRKAFDEIAPDWESYDGLVIAGTHSPQNVEEQIEKIREAREMGRPALLICLGHQLAAIEYARTVLGIEDATSEEFEATGTFVVKKRGALKVGWHEGESFWNNYEVVIEWEKPAWFFSTQGHPEYTSSIDKPHPLLVQFLTLCRTYNGNVV